MQEVMNMMREVFLFQYKNSPSVIEYLRMQGAGSRVEPFQRLLEVCTPDSLDAVCSVYEAYRSIVQQCIEAGNISLAKLLHQIYFVSSSLSSSC